MIEVDNMIVFSERCRDDVANVMRVLRDRDAERILHGAQTAERMGRRADAADTLDIRPRVARVTVVHDELEPAPCRAGRDRILYFPRCLVDLNLDAQMSLDTGNRIYNNVFHSCTSFSCAASSFSWRCFCTRLAPACAATPTAVATARPAPTMSTSMPLYSGSRRENGA